MGQIKGKTYSVYYCDVLGKVVRERKQTTAQRGVRKVKPNKQPNLKAFKFFLKKNSTNGIKISFYKAKIYEKRKLKHVLLIQSQNKTSPQTPGLMLSVH